MAFNRDNARLGMQKRQTKTRYKGTYNTGCHLNYANHIRHPIPCHVYCQHGAYGKGLQQTVVEICHQVTYLHAALPCCRALNSESYYWSETWITEVPRYFFIHDTILISGEQKFKYLILKSRSRTALLPSTNNQSHFSKCSNFCLEMYCCSTLLTYFNSFLNFEFQACFAFIYLDKLSCKVIIVHSSFNATVCYLDDL